LAARFQIVPNRQHRCSSTPDTWAFCPTLSDKIEGEEEQPAKKSKLPLILGLVLALLGGGGGFFAVSQGMILGDSSH